MSEVFSIDLVINVAAQEVIGTLLAIVVAFVLRMAWKKSRFSGWTVTVIKPDGEVGTNRPIGEKKIEEILDDMTTMSVYLKGLVSPYGWLVIDLVVDGPKMGVLDINKRSKTITTIDLTSDGVLKESR